MSWEQHTIRRAFLDFFAAHATLPHQEVSSSPIIPRDDPTLYFTNAGMNQFKSLLLGEEKRDYTRACSVQKCMRVSGKHNDLDAVGKDGRHLTWFEMLGNWSFGDYYKREAITMAWKLSTEVYKLDKERIYVSVYKDDDESYAIWRDEIGVPEARIYRFGDVENGDEENFWSMGPTGPCGPCTELFYDLGPEAGDGPEDVMGGEGDRYMEFWNNVFMEFNRDADGKLTPLALQSVDTGMGMERITMILQGHTSVFDTDLFQPIIDAIAGLCGADKTDPVQKIDLQIIADHLRSVTFVISEGGQFSNEGRGYVLRRILRRAVRHGRRLGFEGPFLHKLVNVVAEQFKGVYALPPHILANTAATLEAEEARFFRTIDRGMALMTQLMEDKAGGARLISGEEMFKLYDTYGFPPDLTRIEAAEHGFSVDEAGFEAEMERVREEARSKAKFYDDGAEWTVLGEGGGRGFADYNLDALETRPLRWRAREGGAVEMVLAETPLYAESGGEIADHGTIKGPGFTLAVHDVQKVNGVFFHHGALTAGAIDLRAEDTVTVTVDTTRRDQKRIHHTATHLLHAALKAIVGPHVEQKGSVVEPDRLRFDFSHGKPLSADELAAVQAWANARIRENEAVIIEEGVPIDEARARGVVALFGEKYGEAVRTVRAGGQSFELCGGNHARRTGDISYVVITSESGVAAGVRRIEAVVGHAAEALLNQERAMLAEAAALLKTAPARLLERLGAVLEESRELSKALTALRQKGGGVDLDALLAAAVEIGGGLVVAAKVEVDSRETLSALVDRVRDKHTNAVVVLGAVLEGKGAVIAAKGPALKADKRFHAGQIVQAITGLMGGRGGGRPDFAQGGGEASRLAAAMAQAVEIIRGQAG
ncbi:alanine--tRNA ligase [Myxococcota bacterium]|nr:alanine--tRNA ligase [Myxococcota bacterium]